MERYKNPPVYEEEEPVVELEDTSLKKKKQSSVTQNVEDKIENPLQENLGEDENDKLINGGQPSSEPPKKLKARGCCMRILCLLFCCETQDIGWAANLNSLDEKEIEIYQKQLKKEMDKRTKLKSDQDGNLASDGVKPHVEVVPSPQIASQGSKQTMVWKSLLISQQIKFIKFD